MTGPVNALYIIPRRMGKKERVRRQRQRARGFTTTARYDPDYPLPLHIRGRMCG